MVGGGGEEGMEGGRKNSRERQGFVTWRKMEESC